MGDAGSANPRKGLVTRNRFARSLSNMGEEDEDTGQLRVLLPKLRKLIEKEGANGEQVLYAVLCNKINEWGKVQGRLLVLTDQAVYNLSANGLKCKRRIPLSYVGLVTASEASGQFVLHVPSEYDYHYAAVSRGLALFDDEELPFSAPLDEILGALQYAYAKAHAGQAHLPVRKVFNDGKELSTIVKKKKDSALDSEEGMLIQYQRGEDDDDTD